MSGRTFKSTGKRAPRQSLAALAILAWVYLTVPIPVYAQTVGGACSVAAGSTVLTNGLLLVCNGSTWTLGEGFTSSGNVGIGTTTPSTSLSIGANSLSSALSGTTNTSGLNLYMLDNGNAYIDALVQSTNTSALSLRTYNSGTYNTGIYINSSGNVGIGTTSSSTPLEVYFNDNDFNPALTVYNPNTGGDAQAKIELNQGTSGAGSIFEQSGNFYLWNSGSEGIYFYNNGGYAISIAYNNYVGIGTTSPSYPLDVQSSTGGSVAIRGENSGTASNTIGVWGYAPASSSNVTGVYGSTGSTGGTGVKGYASSTTGSTTGVFGNVASSSGYGVEGYASSTAGSTTGVFGNVASSTGTAVFGNATASTGTTYGVYGESQSASGDGGYFTNSNGGYSLITGSGSVGIGTTSPNHDLYVNGIGDFGSGGGVIRLQNAAGVGDIEGINDADSANNALQIRTGINPTMYFNTSGDVGIGTTSPGYTLQVNGTTYITGNTSVGAALASTVSCSVCLPTSLANLYTQTAYVGGDDAGELFIGGSYINANSTIYLNYNSSPYAHGFSTGYGVYIGNNLQVNGDITLGTWEGSTIGAAYGGLGVASPTAHDVLVGEGSLAVTAVSPSTSGYVLTSNGTTSDPSFQAFTGSSGITTVGTITGGTWQGSTIAVAYGGTGTTTSTGSGSAVLSTSPLLTGPVGIGTINASGSALVVSGNSGQNGIYTSIAGSNTNAAIEAVAAASTGFGVYADNTGSSCAGWLAYNGFSGGGNCGTSFSSDARLKKDVAPVQGGLDTVLKLKPVTFLWKKDNKNHPLSTDPDKKARNYGFIAQDVQKVLPDLVSHQGEMAGKAEGVKVPPGGFFGLDYNGLIAPTVKAVQELYTKWNADHDALAALKADNDNLRAEVQRFGNDEQELQDRVNALERTRRK